MAISTSTDEFPIIQVRFGEFTDEEHERGTDEMFRKILASPAVNTPFVVISDLQNSPPLNAVQRRRVVKHMQDSNEVLRQHLVALIYVTDSKVKKGILTAMNWFVDMPGEFSVVATREVAFEKAHAALARSKA